MIPKIIHFTWFGPRKCPVHLMDTWSKMNPDFTIKLWTEDNIGDLHNQSQFDSMVEFCGKSDIARYEILYRHGGIYMDIDSIARTPLGNDFTNYHGFACWENEVQRPGLIANGYIGVEPGNNVMRDMIDRISSIYPSDINRERAWKTTGPIPFTEIVMRNIDKISILPSYYFMPKHLTGEEYTGDGKIYGDQLWGTGLDIYGKILQ